jgi:prepilin-type N-terminal cleavage/methylation domain-containing protein
MTAYVKHKKGFTLLEVIFVIVILGIVSSISATILAQLYENYIMQRAMHRVSLKTELAINQIVNRLTYRIGSSVIARNPTDNTFIRIDNIVPGEPNRDNIVLEWIGYDNDSFIAQTPPLWNGYCDTVRTVADRTISTPGSRLRSINAIIQNLSPTPNPKLALLFSLEGQPFNQQIPNPNAGCYGFNEGNRTCIHRVSIENDTTFKTDNFIVGSRTRVSDHYKLAWSAYAIVPVDRDGNQIGEGSTTTDFDLALKYGYQPWKKGTYKNASSSILIRNVTAFKFSEQGGTLRLKLCATEQIGDSDNSVNVSVCKEKVVLR